ncbi:SGNH/GDSL hydrolase family protein [Wenxinia marina]|uniref:Lysophospholipase L1 n=1 Tax=Wenxinia marina DSM 24838 TaxID=1123501 RepID=A0A0D0Q9A8_9RHOB|nr:SGNH/GDSL hydrolase family protein [Wenxinia marina]KIQ67638.1 Lysophospholipase L1 [Wenxinia marina DSM 24838]GGL80074.1 hypothetical protein GCM10011392_38300 [Wenxinia marina]
MRALAAFAVTALAACAADPPDRGEVLIVGDSVMAWNRLSGQSVGDVIAAETGLAVANAAVPGAGFLDGAPFAPIGTQYADAPGRRTVVIAGGANDLRGTCGCESGCAPVLDALISGGEGAIPDAARRALSDGADVILVGYYSAPVGGGPFSVCSEELGDLDARLAAFAEATDGVRFVDPDDAIDPARTSLYDDDRTHPSPEGSARIGALIAAEIAEDS